MKRFLILFLVLFISCTKSQLPEYNRLDSMRVLALKVNNPETSIAASVTITPVISDISGGGRTITYSAQACADPGIGVGAYPDCSGSTSILDLGTGTITGLSAPNYTGATNTFTFSIPTTVFDGKTALETYNGIPYIFLLSLKTNDGNEVRSFKRIIVSTKSNKNTNPSLSNILSDGQPMTRLTDRTVSLKVSYSPSSEENYLTFNSDGGLKLTKEILVTTWFVSQGSLGLFRTIGENENPFTMNYSHNGPVVILGVLRDDRGGEDYIKLEL